MKINVTEVPNEPLAVFHSFLSCDLIGLRMDHKRRIQLAVSEREVDMDIIGLVNRHLAWIHSPSINTVTYDKLVFFPSDRVSPSIGSSRSQRVGGR